MVYQISNSDQILPCYGLKSTPKFNLDSAFHIPLILYNHSQIMNGQCKKLHFSPLSDLKNSELSNLNKKTLCCAKAILLNGKHIIKVDETINELDFDELDYSFTHEGQKIEVRHQKGAASIEVMDAEEQDEIQTIVIKALSKSENENSLLDKSIENGHNAHAYCIESFPNSTVSQLFSIYSRLNAEWRKLAASEAQRRLEEMQIQVHDSNKKSYNKKEAQWQQRQKHFEIKDQNRTVKLEQFRKRENSQFEARHREIIQS
jgi:hypothetical protein